MPKSAKGHKLKWIPSKVNRVIKISNLNIMLNIKISVSSDTFWNIELQNLNDEICKRAINWYLMLTIYQCENKFPKLAKGHHELDQNKIISKIKKVI